MAIALLTDSTAGARETDRAKLMSRALRAQGVADRGPPVRRVRRMSRLQTELGDILTVSATWPKAARLGLLALLPIIAAQPDDAVNVAQWMQDDLFQEDWDMTTQRRMAGLVHLALVEPDHISIVEPIRAKFAGSTAPAATLAGPYIPDRYRHRTDGQ